jgi:hypothetical protein
MENMHAYAQGSELCSVIRDKADIAAAQAAVKAMQAEMPGKCNCLCNHDVNTCSDESVVDV